jgi:alpha-glucosidase (family GH31 glycosyl hydrolase)
MEAYFKFLHNPYEIDSGIDFWWIDWQHGSSCNMKYLDPLSWLNILHYEDRQKNFPNLRPMIFSRYGGMGSHRYPIGFSGGWIL